MRTLLLCGALALTAFVSQAQRRLVIVDQDASGPGGSDQMAMMALLESTQVKVLGITIVTGDAWRDEEVLHTLRMLELTGHTDVPVAPGAVFPLVRSQKETTLSEPLDGRQTYLGAWRETPAMTAADATQGTAERPKPHGPYDIPLMPEGRPTIKALDEDAAHFLVRQVRAHPHEVTIVAVGPLTNIALAISLDPEFASLTKGIALMGGSLNPQTEDPEFATDPRHEFNLWFDPEAAHIVLRADWPRIDVTTADVSLKAPFSQEMLDTIAKSKTKAAQYITAWSQDRYYMWDEFAACSWIDPTLVTKESQIYMDVDLSRGPHYGDTLTWNEKFKPDTGVRLVHAQLDLNLPRFQKMFVDMMTGNAAGQ